MSEFILECTCGSTEFEYLEDNFKCVDCFRDISENDAGHFLIEKE